MDRTDTCPEEANGCAVEEQSDLRFALKDMRNDINLERSTWM